MGRFVWNHGQSKQVVDKAHTVGHEWVSKENAEPSRQALTGMMEDHSILESGNSDTSLEAQSRPRTNTVASSFSVYARSISDGSNELPSRPPSLQSFGDSGMPLPERHESTARTFLARGTRILKRQGSKLNLLPSQMEEKSDELPTARVGEVSTLQGLYRQPSLSSRRLKRSISGPFAFQHLNHGDQACFQSLNSVSKADSSCDFDAVQSLQHPGDQIHGIAVADLPVKRESVAGIGYEEPASPTTNAIPYLPITPPRPKPPPKDGFMSPCSPSAFRFSRSIENFSRPTRLSVTASDISPITASAQRLSAMTPTSPVNALTKPLPHLPDSQVVHAVSTRDDVALPLPTAPLPSPPKAVMEVVEEEAVEEGESLIYADSLSQTLLQFPLTVPTTKQHKRRSQYSGEIQLSAISLGGHPGMSMLATDGAKNAGDDASPKPKDRVSVAFKPEDWDDAIDYFWEHAAELETEDHACSPATSFRQTSALSIPHKNYLIVEQSHNDETISAGSTPLTMQVPDKPYRDIPSPPAPGTEEQSRLLGLGIDALYQLSNATFSEAAVGALHEAENSFASGNAYHSRVSPVSMISKSSSRESFIASIFGTQRSSNSSTSLADFAHLANGSYEGSVENLKLDLQNFSCTPATDKHFREGSQDTIREDPQHTKSIGALADMSIIASLPSFTTSPTLKHNRGASASAILIIPRRKSSLADAVEVSKTQIGRTRATTGTSRPRRNTRVSYSLFPAPPST